MFSPNDITTAVVLVAMSPYVSMPHHVTFTEAVGACLCSLSGLLLIYIYICIHSLSIIADRITADRTEGKSRGMSHENRPLSTFAWIQRGGRMLCPSHQNQS
jgi:hypothetical protein